MLEWLLFIASGGHWGPRTRSLYCSSIKWSLFCGIHDKCECIEFGLKPYLVERWAGRYMLAFTSWSDRPSTHPSVWWCMPTSVHPFVVYRFSLYVCNVLLSLLLNFEQAVYMFYLHFFSSSSARTQKVRSVGKFVSFFLLAIFAR